MIFFLTKLSPFPFKEVINMALVYCFCSSDFTEILKIAILKIRMYVKAKGFNCLPGFGVSK